MSNDDVPLSWGEPVKGNTIGEYIVNLIDKLLSYLPSYLLMLWHNVWYIGLISVYSTLCYKLIITLLALELYVKG